MKLVAGLLVCFAALAYAQEFAGPGPCTSTGELPASAAWNTFLYRGFTFQATIELSLPANVTLFRFAPKLLLLLDQRQQQQLPATVAVG
jgi:hypothetical protein